MLRATGKTLGTMWRERFGGLGFAYVMTQMNSNISADPRRDRLVDAVYSGLAAA